MAEEVEAAAAGGEPSFEQEMEAARVADGALAKGEVEAPEGETDAKEGEEAGEGKEKPPLSPEELAKRNSDLQKATRSERQKRRELERTLAAVQQRLDRYEAGQGSQSEQPAERPDPSDDPIGYLEYVEKMLSAADAKTAEQRQQEQARQEAQRETEAIVSRVAEYENDFRELNPDYDAAVEHLYGLKKAEYEDSGYSPEEAHAMVMQEFLTRSKRAFAAGKDPAEIVYSLAKKGGYSPKGGEKDPKAGEQRLEAVERGQRATSALSAAPGGGARELSAEAVSRLNGAAFDAAFAKLRERALEMERQTGI